MLTTRGPLLVLWFGLAVAACDRSTTPVGDTGADDAVHDVDEIAPEVPDAEPDVEEVPPDAEDVPAETDVPDDVVPDGAGPVEPHRETHEPFTVVWLSGTPREMGRQHGELLHDELARGLAESSYVGQIVSLVPIARLMGLIELARTQSYPDIVEECEGMVETAGDVGWTMDLCLMVNFGDVLVESMPGKGAESPSDACSQFVVAGEASADGRLLHGRLLDWGLVDFLLWYPVIFVRQPSDGLAHVYVGFPGNLSPYSGMNVAGLSGGSNETDPASAAEHDRTGRSHVQMLGQVLRTAHDLEEARAFILGEDHMSVEQLGIADGPNRTAAAFEMTATRAAARDLADGVLFLTNHFVAPEMVDLDADPAGASSLLRFDRLAQLVPRDGPHTLFGTFDPAVAAGVLRDRVDPYTLAEVSAGTFDNDGSIATNGALYAVVFDPEHLWFWAAAGTTPVPEQPLRGFSLGELLRLPGALPVTPAEL